MTAVHDHDFNIDLDGSRERARIQRQKARERAENVKKYSEKVRQRSKKKHRQRSKSSISSKTPSKHDRKYNTTNEYEYMDNVTTVDKFNDEFNELEMLKLRYNELETRHLDFMLRGNPTMMKDVRKQIDWIVEQAKETELYKLENKFKDESKNVLRENERLNNVIIQQSDTINELHDNIENYEYTIQIMRNKISSSIYTLSTLGEQTLNIPDDIPINKLLKILERLCNTITEEADKPYIPHSSKNKVTKIRPFSVVNRQISSKKPKKPQKTNMGAFHKSTKKKKSLKSKKQRTSRKISSEDTLSLSKSRIFDGSFSDSRQYLDSNENLEKESVNMSELSARVAALDSALQNSQKTIQNLLNS